MSNENKNKSNIPGLEHPCLEPCCHDCGGVVSHHPVVVVMMVTQCGVVLGVAGGP